MVVMVMGNTGAGGHRRHCVGACTGGRDHGASLSELDMVGLIIDHYCGARPGA